MLFNSIINVRAIEVGVPENAEHVELSLMTAINYPVSQTQMAVLPAGKLRVPLTDRDQVIKLGEELLKQGEKMPKTTGLEVASNLSEVEQAARQMQDFREGPGDGPAR